MKPAAHPPKSPLCHTPNRCGLYVIEQNEQFADLAMRANPVLPELLAYLRGIGESVK